MGPVRNELMPLFDIHAYFGPTPLFDGLSSQDAVQATMRRFNMDAVGLISTRARYTDFIAGNRELKEVLDAEMGIFGYVTANTAYPDESMQEMRVYLTRHTFLGTVMFPQSGSPVVLSDTRELINGARRYTKPILVYVEDREGVRALREIAAEFEQIRFVLLNMAGEDWRAAVAASKHHSNIVLDISGSLDGDKIAYAASQISARKILFGSGMPYSDPNLYTGMLSEAGTVSDLDRRRISFGNALNLFSIDAEVE
jgi:predicted TIM-barrel fold metal-dependent hydrolase